MPCVLADSMAEDACVAADIGFVLFLHELEASVRIAASCVYYN